MTQCRIQCWYSKARKSVPELKSLPPTNDTFAENVKRAHIQVAIWYSAIHPDPPKFDAEMYSGVKDVCQRVLIPVGIPDGVDPAPKEVLRMIKCTCSSSQPCASQNCSCTSAKISCSFVYHVRFMCKYSKIVPAHQLRYHVHHVIMFVYV